MVEENSRICVHVPARSVLYGTTAAGLSIYINEANTALFEVMVAYMLMVSTRWHHRRPGAV
jgi:hypothetical protein